MTEEIKIENAVKEIENTDGDALKATIKKWFESTHMDGMRLGAYMISAAVFDSINKNLKNGMTSSHRDFERAIKKVVEIVSVPLKQQETQQNDLGEAAEEVSNDE